MIQNPTYGSKARLDPRTQFVVPKSQVASMPLVLNACCDQPNLAKRFALLSAPSEQSMTCVKNLLDPLKQEVPRTWMLREYRLYVLDAAGHICERHDLHCADHACAGKRAVELLAGAAGEVWAGTERVLTLAATRRPLSTTRSA